MAAVFAFGAREAEGWRVFEASVRRVGAELESRMSVYINALYHTRGVFMTDGTVTLSEYREFTSSVDLNERYPGALGIGYAPKVTPDQIRTYEHELRAAGFKDFKIWPRDRSKRFYFPIVYLEPLGELNKKALGFDMSSENIRWQAMEMARDLGAAVASTKVVLLQQKDAQASLGRSGFLIYLPLYETGMKTETPEQRRRALKGFVYSPFIMRDLLTEVFKSEDPRAASIDFEIYDGPEPTEENLLYDTDAERRALKPGNQRFFKTFEMTVAHHRWTIHMTALPKFEQNYLSTFPWYVLAFGLVLSTLIYGFTRLAHLNNLVLSRSERQIRLITDSLPALVSYIDKDLRYRFTNRAYFEWFGLQPEDIEGKSIRDLLGQKSFESMVPHLKRAFQGEMVNFESQMPHQSGNREVMATYAPDINAKGGVDGLIVLVNDITALKRTQQQLLAEKRALETTNRIGLSLRSEMDLQKLLQLVTDSATEVVNAQFGAFFYNFEDETGQSYNLFTVSGELKDQFGRLPMPRNTAIFSPTFLGQRTVRSDDITKDPRYGQAPPHPGLPLSASPGVPKGHPTVRSYLAVPVISRSGQVIGGLFFGHGDVGVFSEREEKIVEGIAAQAAVAIDNARLYQSAQVANRTKDEFLATVSHELRTPLNVIMGWAEILNEKNHDDAETRDGVTTILRNAKAQAELINDLLDVSRIITGKLALNPQSIEIRRVVDVAIDSVKFAAEAKEIRLLIEIPDERITLWGDLNRLQQVVWNLLSNAIKFTPRKGTVSLRVHQENEELKIEVSDDGEGIDPDFLPHVFDRFRQQDSASTRKHGGLGLGLAIVRHLVELHGGHVRADSEGRGKGARFTVTLPMRTAQDFQFSSTKPGAASGPVHEKNHWSLRGIRILLVDDSPDTLALMKKNLLRFGADLIAVPSADLALKVLKESHPDILVSDIGMPNHDGYYLIQKVREMSEPVGRIPAIALTAYAGSEDQQKTQQAGFNAHVSKPVAIDSLVEAIIRCASAKTNRNLRSPTQDTHV